MQVCSENLETTLWGKDNDDSHFRDEETEAQPDEVT
jgi:hypothetical protein